MHNFITPNFNVEKRKPNRSYMERLLKIINAYAIQFNTFIENFRNSILVNTFKLKTHSLLYLHSFNTLIVRSKLKTKIFKCYI